MEELIPIFIFFWGSYRFGFLVASLAAFIFLILFSIPPFPYNYYCSHGIVFLFTVFLVYDTYQDANQKEKTVLIGTSIFFAMFSYYMLFLPKKCLSSNYGGPDCTELVYYLDFEFCHNHKKYIEIKDDIEFEKRNQPRF